MVLLRKATYQNPPIGTGEDNSNWRGGPSKCIDCDKNLSSKKYTRCSSCSRKGALNPYHQKCLRENIKSHRELLRAIRNSFKYRQWRSDVYTRDDFCCMSCGERGAKLEAHHIVSTVAIIKKYKISTVEQAISCDKLWDINNGQTLCKKCHSLTDNYKGKNNKLLKKD